MSKNYLTLALALGMAVGLASLRLIHLGADTPSGLSGSDGPYVDEGYKTLSARNLVLFGETHWSREDVYVGWMDASPVTSWAYYASFRLFGATVEAARAVTVLCFGLLLTAFAWAMSGRYRPGLVLIGLALLGLESNLFFFSRIAIFEIPIVAFLCGVLFVFARLKPHRSVVPVLLALATSVLLVFGVKLSALFYVAPILITSSLFLFRDEWFRQKLRDWRFLIPATAGLVLLLAITRDQWGMILAVVQRELHLVPSEYAHRILENPLVDSSPAIVLAGLLCAVHGLVCRPDLFLGNIYRLSLVAMILLGIPLIALIEYDPLRYFMPLLPAHVLIVLEWIHLRGWRFLSSRPTPLAGLLTVAVMTIWLYFLVDRFDDLALFGELKLTRLPLFVTLTLVLAAGIWFFRSLALRGVVVATALCLMLPVLVVDSAHSLGLFFLSPSFQAQTIRSDLTRLLPEDAILAGVWAPFIALGTGFRCVYVASVANHHERLPELAPDFVVRIKGNPDSNPMMRKIERIRGMSIGRELYRSVYNDQTVILYPLQFVWRSNASLRRGMFSVGRSLVREGKASIAEPWLRRTLEERQQSATESPWRIAEVKGEWGTCLVQLGRHAEAEAPLLEAYETFRPGGEAPMKTMARVSLKRLVTLYESWNNPARAAEYRSLLEQRDL
jgi:hypothetical protein